MKEERRRELGIFLILLLAAAYFHHPCEYDNTLSRYYLLSSAVDHGRLDIDPYRGQTSDIALAGGHTYSNKAIGASLMAAPLYWMLRRFTPILSPLSRYLCRLWVSSLPFALLGVVLYRLLLAMGAHPAPAFLAVLAYGLGSLAWLHATLFSGHQLAASCAFFSFAALWKSGRGGSRNLWPWFGAGLLAGMAVLADYIAIGAVLVLTLYALKKCRSYRQWAVFLAGGGICAALLGAYNAHCFGSPWSLSYSHLEGNFLKSSGAGIYGISLPGVKAGLSLLFSPSRGLFFIMPIFVMALPGLWKLKGEEAAVVLGIALSTWLINSGFYGWHGGWTFGPRYLTLALPFLALPLAFSLDLAWFAVLFPLSALQIGLAVAGMPHAPEAIVNPLVECLYPLFQYGYMADNAGRLLGLSGAASLMPWLLATLALVWWAGPRQALALDQNGPWFMRRVLYPGTLAGVLAGLLLTHTPRPVAHAYNWKLLQDVNLDLHSETLRLAGEKELALSKK